MHKTHARSRVHGTQGIACKDRPEDWRGRMEEWMRRMMERDKERIIRRMDETGPYLRTTT